MGLVGPSPGVVARVFDATLEGTLCDAEVEARKDELDGGQVQGVVRAQGRELAVDEAQGVAPVCLDIGDCHTARLGAAHAEHIDPLVAIDDALLLGQDWHKDMRRIGSSPLKRPLENAGPPSNSLLISNRELCYMGEEEG